MLRFLLIYRCLFVIFLLIFFASCEDYLNINSTLKKMVKLGENKYNLEIFGTGVAAPKKINNLRVIFRSKNKYDVDQARKLIVDYTEDFITLIHNNPETMQHINNFPVNEKNLFLFVIFEDKDGNYICDLPAIDVSDGIVTFFKLDVKGGFEENYTEPYTETYFKVYGTEPPIRN